MKKYIIHITSIIFVISLQVNAQQTSLFNTYSFDLMQLNIASIGRTCTEANLNYRSQWLGVKETPKLYQLNAAFALGEKNGLGLKLYQQSMGLLKVTNATLGYSYRVKLNETTKLHFGIGVAFQQNNFEANKTIVLDNNDVSINNNQQRLKSNNFDSEAGILLLADKLTVGVSAIHLYNTNNSFNSVGYSSKPETNIVMAYKFNKGKNVEIEPWLIDRYSFAGNTNNFEGMLNLKIKKIATIGAGYRLNYGYLALVGFEVGKMRIAYSFDYSSGKNAKSLGSSHQILLGFDLCKSKTKKTEPIVEQTATPPNTNPEPVVTKDEEVQDKVLPTPNEPKVDFEEEVRKKQIEALKKVNTICEGLVFDEAKTSLPESKQVDLNRIADILKENKLTVNIVGYASKDGNPTKNKMLSDKRANYIKTELVKRGVSVTQLKIIGLGDTIELYSNNDETLKVKNRTVRIEKVQ